MWNPTGWKARAEAAEAALATEREAMANAARLIGIERNGRVLVMRFERNGVIHSIETYATLDQDVASMRRDLLE